MLRVRSALATLSALVVAGVVGQGTLMSISSQWGERGLPEVSMPSETGPALGYSYSVGVTPPGWAVPVAVAAALASGAFTWRFLRRR